MYFLDFIFPKNNYFAIAIIGIVVILFFVWLEKLIIAKKKLQVYRQEIISTTDVSILGENIRNKTEDIEIILIDSEKTTVDKSSSLSSFFEERNIQPDGPIADHIGAIYKAGLQESRLEVQELLQYTSNRLLADNMWLKNIMSIFIVIGLLGTLIGLTSSLVQLMPALGGLSSMQSANLLNQSMINLMNSLKGAFAPSIWGVFLTILSVIIFSYYLKDNCLPVKILLDQTTLINWIPLLYPTASQKLQESLVTSERQLHQNIEAAQKVAEYAISIREEAGLLANNITQANLSLQQISEQSDSIEKFYESVNSLTSFQTQIKELYDQLIKESSVFQKDTTKSLNRLDKFVNNLFANLESQNGQIQDMLSALKLYEQGYMNYRNEYDSSTRELLKSMIGAVEQMETRNKDLIKELGEPLNNLLVDKLSFLQKEQADHWQEILERFNSMNVPMEKAASIIEISLENATKRTETITLELQRQYASQAEASVKQNETVIKLLSKITNEITNGTFNPSEDAVSEPIDKLTFRQKIGRMIRNGGSKVG